VGDILQLWHVKNEHRWEFLVALYIFLTLNQLNQCVYGGLLGRLTTFKAKGGRRAAAMLVAYNGTKFQN
jgi:hypothetical protein